MVIETCDGITDTIAKEEDRAWKKRIKEIYPSIQRSDIVCVGYHEPLYVGNSFNDPDCSGLGYGDYDYSEYPKERVWYGYKWWL